jgi:hypothetical protein
VQRQRLTTSQTGRSDEDERRVIVGRACLLQECRDLSRRQAARLAAVRRWAGDHGRWIPGEQTVADRAVECQAEHRVVRADRRLGEIPLA